MEEQLLRRRVEEVSERAMQSWKQKVALWEQKKPKELSEEENKQLEWAKRWIKSKEARK